MIDVSAYPESYAAAERPDSHGSLGLGLAVGLSSVVVAGLWISGRSELLRMAIPATATVVGLVLYFSRPIRYVEYSLWVWFLSPLIRRLIDWKFGYVEPNLVLLAPLLVSAIAGLTLIRSGNRARGGRIPVAFVLCVAAVLYAFVVDCLRAPSGEVVYGFVNWLGPMLFGLHLYLDRARFEEYRAAVGRAFLWAVPVMGVYGIYQFFAPPLWDRFWLENANADGLAASFGQPEPLLIRVWSTMNSPGPFANVMMVGLLLLLVLRLPLKLPASVPGYLSFLLSIVRTAWLSFFLGLLLILKSSNPRVLARIVFSMLLLAALILPLASDQRVSTVISDRVSSLTNLGGDESFRDRSDMYRILLNDVMENPFGHGFQNHEDVNGFAVDSGILATVFALGWLGSLLFAAGAVSICFTLTQPIDAHDFFSIAARGIIVAILAQLIGSNVFVNVTGAMLWMFAGLWMAARQQYDERRKVPAAERELEFA